ncbi:MAG: hypothetical protein KBH81_02860 [Phycisphaerae bacterium]|jgi:hypothetical protein|nr:hypothetical protein [Phycisphaerae bacterium]HOO15844.1 hypothetical protein [Phycisphaerae bacterium]HPC22093.1 hypothetical protein [Phycisphaerae bacterium]HRS28175.1 hypothetical protein [Phycisphaerae bacterium]HRT42300.1 hypothetical protein [Phycisphaerae bacterium]
MSRFRNRLIRLTLGLASAGVVFGGGCSVGSVVQYFANFNYGESVLNMTRPAYQFLTSGYQGPGINPDIDPACTYPPFCTNDPFAPQASFP